MNETKSAHSELKTKSCFFSEANIAAWQTHSTERIGSFSCKYTHAQKSSYLTWINVYEWKTFVCYETIHPDEVYSLFL